MAQNDNKDLQKVLIWAAVIGGGYYFVLRPALVKLGIMQDPAAAATEQANIKNVEQYISEATTRQQPTKSLGEWTLIANNIYTDYDQLVNNNNDDAVYQLSRVKNDADVAMLIKAFGQRQSHWFGLFAGKLVDLPSFIGEQATSDDIIKVNDNYARKGIKFRF